MFYGSIIGVQEYSKLSELQEYKQNETEWNKYIAKINNQTWLLRISNTYHMFPALDSMLDDDDISRGYVLMSEIRQLLYNQTLRLNQDEDDDKETIDQKEQIAKDKVSNILNLKDDDCKILTNLINLSAVDGNSADNQPKWYYVEGSYTTLDEDCSLSLSSCKYEIR